jgi:hypothetical protein
MDLSKLILPLGKLAMSAAAIIAVYYFVPRLVGNDMLALIVPPLMAIWIPDAPAIRRVIAALVGTGATVLAQIGLGLAIAGLLEAPTWMTTTFAWLRFAITMVIAYWTTREILRASHHGSSPDTRRV